MKHLISIDQLDKGIIEEIFERASFFEKEIREKGSLDTLRGKLMASLFYEPSTRTRFSFESAMLKLGGSVISESSVVFSSISKGETLEDTIKTIDRYVDIIAMRHPDIGSAERASKASTKPVVNAGDGSSEHPTQALLDIYTIIKEKGDPKKLHIALVGDLKHGRTIHSLIKLLALYGPKITLISPDTLKLPAEYLKEDYAETEDLSKINNADVVYMTRIQRERFEDADHYERLKNYFIINNVTLKNMKKNAIILHPLPRVGEIAEEVDSDSRAKYFDQVENGVYVRMAILDILLNKPKRQNLVIPTHSALLRAGSEESLANY